jgi:hypothetical protein
MAMSRGRWRQRGPGFTDRGLQIRCVSDDQRGVVSFILYLQKVFQASYLQSRLRKP